MTAVPKPLPPHLVTEVRGWTDWCTALGVDPLAATTADAERWVGSFHNQTHAVRLSAINAVAEWHRDWLGKPSPWADNPHPYPLLQRYLPWSFVQAWAWVQELPAPQRQWMTLVLLCRAKAADVVAWGGVQGDRTCRVVLGDRVVPVTASVWADLHEFRKPRRAPEVAAVLRGTPCKLNDLHAALALELQRRGVSETATASIYGRWSAMKFNVVTEPVGLFRTAARTPTQKVGVGL